MNIDLDERPKPAKGPSAMNVRFLVNSSEPARQWRTARRTACRCPKGALLPLRSAAQRTNPLTIFVLAVARLVSTRVMDSLLKGHGRSCIAITDKHPAAGGSTLLIGPTVA